MAIVLLPVLAYLALHLLGREFPVQLWGVDQLHYYPVPVLGGFFALTLAGVALAARPSWSRRLDHAADGLADRLSRAHLAAVGARAGLSLGVLLVAYAARVRSHSLGDSTMWFQLLERAQTGLDEQHSSWLRGVADLSGLVGQADFAQRAFVSQYLDVLVHFQVYRLVGHWLGWSVVDSYVILSCVSAPLYAGVLWKIASRLGSDRLHRLTIFGLTLTLASLQLFFGYGESYTLVLLAAVFYVLAALRALEGGSIWWPALLLGLAGALHLQAFSLTPSLAYLAWRRWDPPVPAVFRRPSVYAPLLLLGVGAGWLLYDRVYPYPLPLFFPSEDGTFAVFSPTHLLTLANELLLLSPFGLLWGLRRFRTQREGCPVSSFLGWAALGTGLLVVVHNAYYAGRDWDLMAFPAPFYTLWGATSLGREHVRQVRWAVLPAVLLHTGLWIGINADAARATARLGNLLRGPGQARHYQAFSLGYFHMAVRDDPVAAVPYYEAAINAAPPDHSEPEALRNRYRKHLGYALCAAGEFERALVVLGEAFTLDPAVRTQADASAHLSYAKSLLGSADRLARRSRTAEADALRRDAERLCQQVLARGPEPTWLQVHGLALLSMGQLAGAADAFRQCLAHQREPRARYGVYLVLAETLHQSGDAAGALSVLDSAVQVAPENRASVEEARARFASGTTGF